MTDRIGMILLLGAALALAPDLTHAGTYRWVDERGNVTYSDRPPQPQDAPVPPPETSPAPVLVPLALPAPAVVPDSAVKPREVTAPEIAAPRTKTRDVKASAQPIPVAKTGLTKVDEILELSGIRAQLGGLLSRVAGELRPAPGRMSSQDLASVDRILAQALRHERFYALVRDAFRPHVDRPSLEATAAWLRSPVARKIVALEIESGEPGTEQKVAAYAAGLKASPPSSHRVELIQRLDWLTGGNDTSADLVAAIARGVTTAVSAGGPPEQRLRPGQIEGRVAQVRARAGDALREVRFMSMLYTYRQLEDEELAEYARFSGSEAGRWYNTAMRKALASALGRAVEQTTAELVRAVPLERWARAALPATGQAK